MSGHAQDHDQTALHLYRAHDEQTVLALAGFSVNCNGLQPPAVSFLTDEVCLLDHHCDCSLVVFWVMMYSSSGEMLLQPLATPCHSRRPACIESSHVGRCRGSRSLADRSPGASAACLNPAARPLMSGLFPGGFSGWAMRPFPASGSRASPWSLSACRQGYWIHNYIIVG